MDRVIVYSALLAATCVILYFSFWASTDTSTYDIAKADVGPDATITFDIESCDLTFVACDADIRPPWLTFANIQADCDKYQVLATRNVDTLEVDDKKHSVTVTNPATEIEHAEEDEEIPDRSVCRILVSVPDNKGVSADERPAIAIKGMFSVSCVRECEYMCMFGCCVVVVLVVRVNGCRVVYCESVFV